MKAAERDDLLIRIDERLKALKDGDEGDVPDIVRHLAKLNGQVAANSLFRKLACWIGSLLVAAVITIAIELILRGVE